MIYIALFRGINVGGNNLLPMKDLKAILEKLGAGNVRTYIQSGNAVFQSKEKNRARLSEAIRAEIGKSRGFDPFVLLLDAEELEKAIAGNPFPEAVSEPKNLHAIFLTSAPKKDSLQSLEKVKAASERFELKGNIFYLHAPDGVGRSKLVAAMERIFGVPTTGRNWRTVTKLMEMAKE